MSLGFTKPSLPLKKGHYPILRLYVLWHFTSCHLTWELAWRNESASLIKVLIYMLLQIV